MIHQLNINYERLTAAIACGIRDGLRLARKEKKDEDDALKIATLTQRGNSTRRKKAK